MTNYILLTFGIYNIVLALIINTKNLLSAFIFKVIPGLGGLFLIILATKGLGWI